MPGLGFFPESLSDFSLAVFIDLSFYGRRGSGIVCHFLFILSVRKAFKKGRDDGRRGEKGRWINKKSMMASSQLHMAETEMTIYSLSRQAGWAPKTLRSPTAPPRTPASPA